MAEAREVVVHQAGDISLRGIATGGGVIATGIALAIVVPWMVIGAVKVPRNAPNDAARPTIRGPAPETAPLEDIAAFRGDKLRRLESDGVDPATGSRHISIERAMEILAARGSAGSPKPGPKR